MTFLVYFLRAGGRTTVAELLRTGAWCSPLPVGLAFALNARFGPYSPVKARLRSYAVALIAVGGLYLFVSRG